MSKDTEFVEGLIVKAPNEKAPDYVKARLSIKRAELIAWLQAREGEWVNADIKVSAGGKWYCAVDSWKPNQGERSERKAPAMPAALTGAPQAEAFPDDDIPF